MLTDAAIAALTKASNQSFVFFPPIRGFSDNQWQFREVTRIEFAAANTASGTVVWFPRSAVSYVTAEEAGITVALRREMSYSGGAVWPARDGITIVDASGEETTPEEPASMPGEAAPQAPTRTSVAPAGLRRGKQHWFREPLALVLATAAGAALALVVALVVARAWLQPQQRSDSVPISDAAVFTLTSDDNYHDVVRKLGKPEQERPLSLAGGDLLQRALLYPSRDYAVVLMGVEDQRGEQQPRYIGAIRLSDGAVIASVRQSHDSTTDALLRIFARQLR